MVFKNKSVEDNLAVDGYSVLPAIDLATVDELLNIYSSIAPVSQEGTTFWSIGNPEPMELIHRSIINKVFPFLLLHFENIKPIISSFVVKQANSDGSSHHQDWTFVDNEPYANSYSCWLPLVDVGTDNGMMGVIKGSHNKFTGYRGSPCPYYKHLFPEEKDFLDTTQYIPMKKGEMLIINHRIIHAALPNQTAFIRPALLVAFTSLENPLVHICLTPGSKPLTVSKYSVNENFFHKYSETILKKLYEQNERIYDFEKLGESPFPG